MASLRKPPTALRCSDVFEADASSNSLTPMRTFNMGNPFQIFGPFDVDGTKVADKEYQKKFWSGCDEEYAQLSAANGLYVFSLGNGSNYDPNYVGITKRDFTREVFN